MGFSVGAGVASVGASVGLSVGAGVASVGFSVGAGVASVGASVGAGVASVGASVGEAVVGFSVGALVGDEVGITERLGASVVSPFLLFLAFLLLVVSSSGTTMIWTKSKRH